MVTELKNLADATEITEKQKMVIWLACQVKSGNMTQEEAITRAVAFNGDMTEKEKE